MRLRRAYGLARGQERRAQVAVEHGDLRPMGQRFFDQRDAHAVVAALVRDHT